MSDFLHDEDCDCGECEEIITLQLEDGDVDCAIVATFPVNGKDYIALLPTEPYGDFEEGEVFLYGYEVIDEEEIELIDIEDEDEYEAVADAFDQLLDEEEFNEADEQ